MTVNAAAAARLAKSVEATLGIPTRKPFASSPCAASEGNVPGQREVGGKGIVELPVRIRRKTDGCQKILQFLHFVGRQRGSRRLQVGKRRIELFQPVPVAAPVKGLVADDIL